MYRYQKETDSQKKEKINQEIEKYRKIKEDGQKNLMVVSEKYKKEMADIRIANEKL